MLHFSAVLQLLSHTLACSTRQATHLQRLLVHFLCHPAQVANDVACLTQVELQQHDKADKT